MKKIAFTLYVSAIIIMFPLYIVLELGYVAEKASEINTPINVIEKVEEPLEAFVKVAQARRTTWISLTVPYTVNVVKL